MITIYFDREKDTLRTVRWKERVHSDDPGPRVGIFYLNKTAVAELGTPDTLRITIEDGDKSLTDLLADIMHWAKRTGQDFSGALSAAEFHFTHETD